MTQILKKYVMELIIKKLNLITPNFI